jgi:hypothetical protein
MRLRMIRPAPMPMTVFASELAVFESLEAKRYLRSLVLWDRSWPRTSISVATISGTIISGEISCSSSKSPARVRKISGEALTTARSATLEFSLKIGEVYDEGVFAFAR